MPPAAESAEAVARRSYGKLVAFLAARTGDVAAAEDALADAFAAALADWPVSGIPRNPEAWLTRSARRRLIDAARRRRTRGEAADHLRLLAEELDQSMDDAAIPDERLALMFACAHPAIDPTVRAPLMLQTILGFDAAAIASAFLVAPATMGQRLVRAKAKIRQAGIPLRVPERAEMPERLDAVLAAIYAAFAGGWLDAARRNLAEEALWLGRLVVSLLPDEPEALGLLALMLHAEARTPRTAGCAGAYVPLDRAGHRAVGCTRMIEEAEALLLRASAMGVIGRYQLEAAVQSAHAARRLTGRSDWAGDRTALRRAVGDHRFAGGGDQPRHCDRRDARGGGGTACLDELAIDTAAGGVPALLGGAGRTAGTHRPDLEQPTRPISAPSVWIPIRRCATSCGDGAYLQRAVKQVRGV